MLFGLLLCGIVVGAITAATSLLAGYSLWAAFGFYVLGGVTGILAGSLGLLLRRRYRGANSSGGQHRQSEPKSPPPWI